MSMFAFTVVNTVCGSTFAGQTICLRVCRRVDSRLGKQLPDNVLDGVYGEYLDCVTSDHVGRQINKL